MNLTQFQNKVSTADKPIVVDFWANWCVPCKVTKPILESLATEYSDKVEFLPIDADHSRDVLENFKVIGIPTVLTIRNGEAIGRVTGAQSESVYRVMFDALADGKEIKIPISPIDRTLRLSAGILLAMYGISSSNWFLLGIGGVIAFLGIYDRCPIWRAISDMLKRR